MRLPFFRQSEKQQAQRYYDLLRDLKALDVYVDHSFEGKTKDMVDVFQQKIVYLINQMIDTNKKNVTYWEKETTAIQLAATDLTQAFAEAHVSWDEQTRKIEQTVEESIRFVEEIRFYPPEYIFSINQLKGHLLDIEENKEKNPLQEEPAYEQLRTQVQKDLSDYHLLHQETVQMLEKIEKKKIQNKKAENNDIIETKERLYRHLQMGKLTQAKSELKKLTKAYKRWA